MKLSHNIMFKIYLNSFFFSNLILAVVKISVEKHKIFTLEVENSIHVNVITENLQLINFYTIRKAFHSL